MITWKKKAGNDPVTNHFRVLQLFFPIFKNDEIQKNDTDKNTKFSAKGVHCVIYLSIFMKYLFVKFIMWNLHVYAHILCTVLTIYRIYSFVWFCSHDESNA